MKLRNHLLPSLLLAVALGAGAAWKQYQNPAWNPDAGYIPSWTDGATVTASSNQALAGKVLDGDLNTAWQSEAPLPEAFIARPDLNIFLHKKFPEHKGRSLDRATDGDLATAASLSCAGPLDSLVLKVDSDRAFFVSLKAAVKAPLEIYFYEGKNHRKHLTTIGTDDNFQLKRFEFPHHQAYRLVFVYSADFQLFELAGLAGEPTESVTVDLGEIRPIGQVHARHWAGDSTAVFTKIFLSADGKTWEQVGGWSPDILQNNITNLPKEILARFIKIEHTLKAIDWNKVFVWEVKAYDIFGPYGQKPPPVQGHTTIKEMLGVNGYWSFGTDQYSDQLGPDGGPYRFKPVATHLRNYHDLTWDLKSPSDPIDFGKMANGGGTPATEWLNWDREYRAWHEGAGMNVQASIQFYKFKPEDWKNPRADGRRYAEAFARHFGQKHGNGFVCSMEVGNEPWHYPAAVYREILLGMAEGAAAGDPTVEVFPCALQAVDPQAEKSGPWKNYIGDRITPEAAKLLDGINVHCYSYAYNPDFKTSFHSGTDSDSHRRRGVQPEHANSTFWEILNAIRWRNVNMPGKKIYLSEWGWDSDGAGEDCTHDVCVSEDAAAKYAVRGALIATRLGIDRATWFFHANDKTASSLYTRSGLLGSSKTGFAKKKTFLALQQLVEKLGDKYFISVLQENEWGWAYFFGDAGGKVTHLVVWRPADSNGEISRTSSIKIGKRKAKAAWLLDGASNENVADKFTNMRDGELILNFTDAPLLVELE
jgi:hypothetical protein